MVSPGRFQLQEIGVGLLAMRTGYELPDRPMEARGAPDTDWYGNRIVKLDPEGKALAAWSGSDVGVDRFVNVQDIAVDQEGNIYLTDSTEDLVRKFRQPAFPP